MTQSIFDPPAIVRAADDLEALAKEINAEHAAAEGAVRSSLEHARAAGEKLLLAKKACQYGTWMDWQKKNLNFKTTAAWSYIKVAENWDRFSDSENLSIDAALRLLSADGEHESTEPSEPESASVYVQPNCIDEVDAPSFECPTCGEVFDKEKWHCQGCNGHYPNGQTECPKCHNNGDKEPAPRAAPVQAEAVTLDQWNAMSEAERKRTIREAKGTARFNDQGDNDNIEWALWSWNPVTGCLHNCPYCYARDIANRFYPQKFQPSLIPSRLRAPQNTPFPTEKAAEWMGHKNVFTCSMADLFGRWVPSEWIHAILDACSHATQWNFLFLTKFPQRLAEFEFPDNAWVGTSVDCQARVANAEKAFRKVRAGVKWLSCEPLIEPLRFTDLGMFDWLVLGGASKSTQTPEWYPPRSWIEAIEDTARKSGCKVYEKSNLLSRIRQYPGVEPKEPTSAPVELQYLPTDKK